MAARPRRLRHGNTSMSRPAAAFWSWTFALFSILTVQPALCNTSIGKVFVPRTISSLSRHCQFLKDQENSITHTPAHTTAMSLCINRLQEERKQWRKDHPFGFFAKPARGANGVTDLKTWEVGIPGRSATIWAGGLFKLTMTFPDEYPTKPPKCKSLP